MGRILQAGHTAEENNTHSLMPFVIEYMEQRCYFASRLFT
jgi:hypothetical protein